ncbi:MAG TPA: thiamine-phosphate kinase [Terriglobia bacterium]|nr:thiamine-phosphate kinase [Terriglobia bacterium]
MRFRTEREFLRWLMRRIPSGRGLHGRVVLGIGDDAALLQVAPRHELILTADMSIEGIHFMHRIHPAGAIGHRALARSLSDIAAMGGVPRYALVSLALSRRSDRAWIRGVYKGMLALAERFDVTIIGGDTAVVRGPTFLDILVAGEVPRGRAILRSGARPGDLIYVSGTLGLSALGLRRLRLHLPKHAGETRRAIRAHLYPEPQCALGRYLASQRLASALMDISDGLSIDLLRLTEASSVGAALWAESIPRPDLSDPGESLDLALHGGEDYQLLFTVPPGKVRKIPRVFHGLPLRCIGEIHKGTGVSLIDRHSPSRELKPGGWDHFRRG